MVFLGGCGELCDWEIMNVFVKGYSIVIDGNDVFFFVIYVKFEGGKVIIKGLMGFFYDLEY